MTSTAWTVQTAAGATVTVEITPTTTFGTSTLAVGDEVIVVGARHGTTVTATRIAMAPTARSGPATTTPVPATTAD